MSTTTPSRKPDYTSRNVLTVGIFGGGMAGFLAAMLLGVLKPGEDASMIDWIMAVTAVAAAFISGLAVVLVAQTLQATRETLQATQTMARDQKRIGEAQTRPWILLEGYELLEFEDSFTICLELKNYGTTPATDVVVYGQLEEYEFEKDQLGEVHRHVTSIQKLYSRSTAAVAPSTTYSIRFNIPFEDYDFNKMPSTHFTWHYKNHDRTIEDGGDCRLSYHINQHDKIELVSIHR